MSTFSPLIEVRGVSRRFVVGGGLFQPKRSLCAVDVVNLSISQGEAVALVGESGCGKSTLARMVLGLLPPTAGAVYLDGQLLGGIARNEVARFIQPVFQNPYASLNPRKSIGEIIALPLKVQRDSTPSSWRRRVEAVMEKVGLPRALYGRYPSEVSGGQRQRVAVARAVIQQPRILICDEPTSALDVSVQAQILNLLQDLQRDLGLAYLLITHNLAVVRHMAQRVAVMYFGRIVEEAETEALFGMPQHPYTQALLESVLTPEPGFGIRDAGLGGAFPNPLDPPSGCRFHPRCPRRLTRCDSEAPQLVRNAFGVVECHLHQEASKRTKQ